MAIRGMKSLGATAVAILTALFGGACAQTQSAPAAASQVIGEVTARDIQAGQISLSEPTRAKP